MSEATQVSRTPGEDFFPTVMPFLLLAVLDPARVLDVRQALFKEGVAVRIVTAKS